MNLTQDQLLLIQEHPAQVYNQMTGSIHIVMWYDYNEGHNLVLVRELERFDSIFKRLYEKHETGLEIKGLWHGEFVSPTLKMQVQIAENKESNLRRNWVSYVGADIEHYQREVLGKRYDLDRTSEGLPSGVRLCEMKGENEDHPWLCDHCFDGFVIEGVDPRIVWPRWKTWHAEQTKDRGRDRHAKPFTAPLADEKRSIWVASAQFGHHMSGVGVNEFQPDKDGAEPYSEGWWETHSGLASYMASNPALFLFQGEKDDHTKALSRYMDFLKSERASIKERKAKSEETRKQRVEQDHAERKLKTMALIKKLREE